MPNRPNILLFLTDAMQAETVRADHQCLTPNFEKLADRGLSLTQAHTTCPTCSPARASLMTGLLPHNHGVLEVEHGRDPDQCVLRTDKPHFAQRLSEAGYTTGYFGKWHIERTGKLEDFGWQQHAVKGSEHVKHLGKGTASPESMPLDESLTGWLEGPPGYNRILHFGVTETEPNERYPGISVTQALEFLDQRQNEPNPWCCCVSFSEPNEALIVSRRVWEMYDGNEIELPANLRDDFHDRPNLYRREQQIAAGLSEDHWRAARRCYYGRITELDEQLARLTEFLEQTGQLENTVIVMLSDHGRYVGGHGFDAHNFGPFEEIYRIPLVFSGPGIAEGQECSAQVGIADLCPTLLELTGCDSIKTADSQSFASLLSEPNDENPDFQTGYAEYHGTRFPLAQRILWEGPWKFVFNGFDFDELYNLDDDPHEMKNLAGLAEYQDRCAEMMGKIWQKIRDTGDRALWESHYFSMRLGKVGPNAAET